MTVPLPMPDSCVFCETMADEPMSPALVEAAEDVALLVPYEQRGRPHVLVVPRRHAATLWELEASEAHAVMDAVQRLARALVLAANGAEGVAVWQNNGTGAFQRVPHVHVHVGLTVPGGGIDGDVPGAGTRADVPKLDLAERGRIAAGVRAALAGLP